MLLLRDLLLLLLLLICVVPRKGVHDGGDVGVMIGNPRKTHPG